MSVFIRQRILSVAFIALILPYVFPGFVESRAEAQVSKQSRANADQQAIIEAYRTVAYGLRSRDINQAFSIFAPEYTVIGLDGKVKNLEQLRSRWQRDLQNIYQIVTWYEFKQIQINESTATVVAIGHQTIVFPDRRNPQVIAYVGMSRVFAFQETWKRTSGGWKATSGRILQEDVSVGQPQYPVN